MAPANATIVSGQGTNAVTINFVSGFSTGNLTVTATNCFGTSAARILALKTIPLAPGTITGLINNVCGTTTGIVYSILPILGASSYSWVVTGGTIISGQGTTSITVDFPAVFASATVKVKENTSCSSTGAYRSVTVYQKPATPGTITGLASACLATSNTFSVVAVSGATNYTWTEPVGWAITSGQGTIAATLTTGAAAGNLQVTASNACGTSAIRTKALTITAGCRLANASNLNEEANENIAALKLYPNPANGGELTIELDGFNTSATLQILDVLGKQMLLSKIINDGLSTVDISMLSSGIYVVEVKNKTDRETKRLVIEK
ncbi:MAG: T9SS type A sorting domain-containing protein [Bacteroidetes bacterium]|nr:T9SS type A sorting domain-containing protein [Bacteroidota bacterium]